MRLIHRIYFTPTEVESYRQSMLYNVTAFLLSNSWLASFAAVFNNLVYGLRLVLEAMATFGLELEEQNEVAMLPLHAP